MTDYPTAIPEERLQILSNLKSLLEIGSVVRPPRERRP